MHKQHGWRRFFLRGDRLHPVWRVLIYLVGLVIGELVLDTVAGIIYAVALLAMHHSVGEMLASLSGGGLPRPLFLLVSLLRPLVYGGIALLLGRLLDREPRETMGLCRVRAGRDWTVGLGLGLAAMLTIGGIELALGWASPTRGNGTWLTLLVDMLAFLPAAAAEEIAFRGYLQRAIAAWRGPVWGIVVTSLLFALFHGLNPHTSWLALLNIALAGVVFALAAERTATLWLPLGYHFAWNLAQGSLLGLPVSGLSWDGLLALGSGGPELWSGGPFGPEGGLLATLILLLSLIPLWMLTRRPATVAAAYRRQRAALEATFGPLPHAHHRLQIGEQLFGDVRNSVAQGEREGEVVLLLRRADGEVLLHTKQFYPDNVYRLPSGGINPQEGVMQAAGREAVEETGLTLHQSRPLKVITYTLQHGRQRMFFHSWLVTAQVTGEAASQDDGERISGFRWVAEAELGRVADDLHQVPVEWRGWGDFRALAHEAATM